MQRIVNYGSFLQSYSLKKNLEKMGAEVCMVDYHVGKPLVSENRSKKSIIKKKIKSLKDKYLFPREKSMDVYDKHWKMEYKITCDFINEIQPMIGVTKEKNYTPDLDLLIVGSDEVFNCLQTNPDVGYSKELFGYGNKADKIITYAASFGNTKEEGLKKYGIYDEVKDMILKFDDISVRDDNSSLIISNMGVNNIHKNVDPVFLYDYEQETDIEVPYTNYIVVYSYSCRISKEEARAIKKFAKKYNKKVICVEGHQKYFDEYIAINPFEVLAYFRKADFIVTDTFHGTVFSIKYNKQFVTLIRKGVEQVYGNSEKLEDLLKTFNLGNRELTNVSDLEDKLLETIDYEPVNMKISSEKQKALDYLRNFVE